MGNKIASEPFILTLVEGQARFALTMKLAEKKAKYVNEAVQEWMKSYPIKSITTGSGSEFASLSQLEGVEFYFTHPYSSHERGSNENFNGLLREFVPKGVSMKKRSIVNYSGWRKRMAKPSFCHVCAVAEIKDF